MTKRAAHPSWDRLERHIAEDQARKARGEPPLPFSAPRTPEPDADDDDDL